MRRSLNSRWILTLTPTSTWGPTPSTNTPFTDTTQVLSSFHPFHPVSLSIEHIHVYLADVAALNSPGFLAGSLRPALLVYAVAGLDVLCRSLGQISDCDLDLVFDVALKCCVDFLGELVVECM
jgi:hypothetical protein